ncbi:MAG: DUF2971 domain-containing protein [Muribaculaceae bacterium]|nr:DUF2971 domain-containing protein [Muribaculaceae bacterium]
MKLYHYTTIDSLAHILNSRSIKFNRLDQLDDLTESEEFSDFNPLRFTFSSSFTGDKRENIALWKMYANMETGVRLEFDSTNMFNPQQTCLPTHSLIGNFVPKSIRTALKASDIVNKDFILIFWGPQDNKELGDGIYLRTINYIDHIKDVYQSLLHINPDTKSISYNAWDFGFYKSKYWEFQKEIRLLIYTIPNCSCEEDFKRLISNNRQLATTSIFVPLSDTALDNLQIILSPKITDASRLIVRALTSHLSKVSIKDSALNRIIR